MDWANCLSVTSLAVTCDSGNRLLTNIQLKLYSRLFPYQNFKFSQVHG